MLSLNPSYYGSVFVTPKTIVEKWLLFHLSMSSMQERIKINFNFISFLVSFVLMKKKTFDKCPSLIIRSKNVIFKITIIVIRQNINNIFSKTKKLKLMS